MLNKHEYDKYLEAKYAEKGYSKTNKGQWFKIDALVNLFEYFPNKTWYFKGALNLLVNFEYRREGSLTKDIDVSLADSTIDEFQESILSNLNSNDESIYHYSFIESEELSISTNGYAGKRITLKALLKESKINSNISIDLAIEELEEGFVSTDCMQIYSIERTLADKYVTMIQRGDLNSREKDFIDLNALYSKADKELLYRLIEQLIKVREVTDELIEKWLNVYKNIDFVEKMNLSDKLEEINKSVL